MDRLNNKFEMLNRKQGLLYRKSMRIHGGRGDMNGILWQSWVSKIIKETSFVISAQNLKYLDYQVLNTPKPFKK